MTNYPTTRIVVSCFIFGFLPCTNALGQTTLFDNLDNLIADDFWIDALGPDRRWAQQFLMGDHTTVDSVTLQLQRTGDAPTGSVGVELWQDDGNNHPLPVGDASAKIADIGTVADVTVLPIGSFADVTFDNLNLNIEPNNPYWIVLNYSGLSGLGEPGNSVGWGVAVDDDNIPAEIVPPGYDAFAGTNGAAFANLYRDANPDWIDAPTAFGGGANAVFFTMAVEALPLPPGIVNNPGLDGKLPPGLRNGLPATSRHAVPEPSSVALSLLGFSICVLVRHGLSVK